MLKRLRCNLGLHSWGTWERIEADFAGEQELFHLWVRVRHCEHCIISEMTHL